MGSETPTLAQVLKEAMESRLVELHTSMPAKIVSYNSSEQTASVQPLLQRQYLDGTVVNLPIINSVPVHFPSAGGFFISFPVQTDDECLLIFSERSLEILKEKGGIVDPLDPRKFHISDAIALVGSISKPNKFQNVSSEKLVLAYKTGTSEIHVGLDGKVSIKSSEVLLGDHTLTEFAAIASRVQARLAAIETFLASHIHSGVTPGVGVSGPPTPTFTPDTSIVASSKVKVSI